MDHFDEFLIKRDQLITGSAYKQKVLDVTTPTVVED